MDSSVPLLINDSSVLLVLVNDSVLLAEPLRSPPLLVYSKLTFKPELKLKDMGAMQLAHNRWQLALMSFALKYWPKPFLVFCILTWTSPQSWLMLLFGTHSLPWQSADLARSTWQLSIQVSNSYGFLLFL